MEERTQQPRREEPRHEEPRRVEPVNRTPVTSHAEPASPEMSDYKRRFDHLQVEFIDDPKETVKKAEKLVEEAVERMVTSMHERVNRIHSEMGDGSDDTERLRLVMRRYREFMDSVMNGRAA